MSRNFSSQTKRARELAKKDKRAQKKADARAARAEVAGTAPSTPEGAPVSLVAERAIDRAS